VSEFNFSIQTPGPVWNRYYRWIDESGYMKQVVARAPMGNIVCGCKFAFFSTALRTPLGNLHSAFQEGISESGQKILSVSNQDFCRPQ
jgi:hypothetical protein